MGPVLDEMNNARHPALPERAQTSTVARQRRRRAAAALHARPHPRGGHRADDPRRRTGRTRPHRTPSRCTTLIPAFVLSELRAAFIIGFVIFIPFLVIDLVVSASLMSHGHDDAAAGDGLAAVQAPAVRPRRRLGSDRHRARPSYAGSRMNTERRPGHRLQAMIVAAKLAAPVAASPRSWSASPSRCSSRSPRSRKSRCPSCRRRPRSAVALIVCGHWMISEMVDVHTRAVRQDSVPARTACAGGHPDRPDLAGSRCCWPRCG